MHYASDKSGHFTLLLACTTLCLSRLNVYLFIFKKHQSGCLFKVIKCPNSGCTKMLSKRYMKIHKTMQCSWRKVSCEHCQESVIMNQKQVRKHFLTFKNIWQGSLEAIATSCCICRERIVRNRNPKIVPYIW